MGRAIGGALLWTITMLLFPVLSGTVAAVCRLGTAGTLFLQGGFMALSLLPPFLLARDAMGLRRVNAAGCRRALYFLPLLLIFVPPAVQGFAARPAAETAGTLLLYGAVGFAEEAYFRGVIPSRLGKAFSGRGVFWISTVLFALGHLTAAFTAGSAAEVLLSVLNALIFGALAMEMTLLAGSTLPAAVFHALFDLETKFTVLQGPSLLRAECVRGALMTACALRLAAVLKKSDSL